MQGVDKGNDKFHHTGGEGGDGGAGDPQCGQTQLAEDQDVVAYGVATVEMANTVMPKRGFSMLCCIPM